MLNRIIKVLVIIILVSAIAVVSAPFMIGFISGLAGVPIP